MLDEMRGQQVLITGGLGFIGSNLATKCLELGAKVSIYDCLDPNSGGNFFNINLIRESIDLCFHNILNFEHLSQYIIQKDIIFNCAASTSHPFSMREPWIDLDVNGRGAINLLEAIRRHNPKARLIHLGATTQLGKLLYKPADENHPEFPTDIYSANKSLSEKYVLIYSNAHQLNATVVRLSNVYGPRASIHSPEFTFNNYFVGLALQGKPITIYGDGNQKRNIIFVGDVVDAIIAVAQADNLAGETIFAVSDHHISVAELAEEIVYHIGSGSIKFVEWPEGRKNTEVGDAVISNQKIKSILNWSPAVALETGLLETKNYYKSCLEKYLR